MRVFKTGVLALVLLAALAAVHAQEEDPEVAEGMGEEQPQANQADMEIAEQIFRAVSEECRDELQKSMAERSELSEECRNEIQDAIASGKVKVPQSAQAPQQEAEAEEESGPLYANPVVHVSFFLVAFFAAIGGYVYYVDTELKKVRPVDSKKKDKKKKKKSKKEGGWSIGDM